MKIVYLILNWGFGVAFLLVGLLAIVESPLGGVCLFAMSALLLPPVRSFVFSKTNKEFPIKARGASLFVLFIVFGIFIGQAQEKKEQELAIQQAQEKSEMAEKLKKDVIDYFNTNRKLIIASVKNAHSAKEFKSVVAQSNKYLVAGDEELNKMNAQAKKELAAIHKAEKTKQILAELKSVPTSEYEKNKNLYQQLVDLHPTNDGYKNKVSFYLNKIDVAAKAKLAAEARKKQIESQFSPWDGSHRNLERLIKKAMNDPDSYEHDETKYWDMGDHLVVQTTYRGKNAFGGIVRNFVKAKIDLDGQILQVIDQT